MTKAELPTHEAAHRIISTKLAAGRPVIHVLSDDAPGDGFGPAHVTLEDVFFARISDGAPDQSATGA